MLLAGRTSLSGMVRLLYAAPRTKGTTDVVGFDESLKTSRGTESLRNRSTVRASDSGSRGRVLERFASQALARGSASLIARCRSRLDRLHRRGERGRETKGQEQHDQGRQARLQRPAGLVGGLVGFVRRVLRRETFGRGGSGLGETRAEHSPGRWVRSSRPAEESRGRWVRSSLSTVGDLRSRSGRGRETRARTHAGALGSFVALSIGDGTGAAGARRAARLSSPLAPDSSPLSARRFRNCSRIRIKVRWHASWYRRSRSPSAVSSNPSRASAAADSDSRRRASNSSSRSSSSDTKASNASRPASASAGAFRFTSRSASHWLHRSGSPGFSSLATSRNDDFPWGSIASHAR